MQDKIDALTDELIDTVVRLEARKLFQANCEHAVAHVLDALAGD